MVHNQVYISSVSMCREGPGISYGLYGALAGKGVILKDKVFRNLKASELQKKGASITGTKFPMSLPEFLFHYVFILYLVSLFWIPIESFSGLPMHIRGNVLGGASETTKAQFGKLLKQACFDY